MADITTPPPWANGKNYGQTHHARLSTSLQSQLLVAPGAHTLSSPLFGWTGLGSAQLHSVFITWIYMHSPMGMRDKMVPLPLCGGCSFSAKAMLPAMTCGIEQGAGCAHTALGSNTPSATARKLEQCMRRKPMTEMLESRKMGNALSEIGKTLPMRSATSGAFILVWFTAFSSF